MCAVSTACLSLYRLNKKNAARAITTMAKMLNGFRIPGAVTVSMRAWRATSMTGAGIHSSIKEKPCFFSTRLAHTNIL